MWPTRYFQTFAVAYPTKILFWKRITAIDSFYFPTFLLLLILQRYYFESESQLFSQHGVDANGCCLSYKDTILKANHSLLLHIFIKMAAVAYPTKILFWKRITATSERLNNLNMLLLILQRYYFESESQRLWKNSLCGNRCCLSYKDTILKANHSSGRDSLIIHSAVAYPTKILFWKRITAVVFHL